LHHVGSGSGDGGGAGALMVYTRASASKAPASRGSFLLLHFLLLLLSFPLRSHFSVIRFFLCSSPFLLTLFVLLIPLPLRVFLVRFFLLAVLAG
jgi:hypothetical protein